jgi:polygalacturonase
VRACVGASKRKNIAITGEGILDGGGQQWRPVKRSKMSDVEWNQYLAMGGQVTAKGDLWYPWQMNNGYADIANTPQEQEAMRNDLIRLTDCRNVLVEGVTIQNAPARTSSSTASPFARSGMCRMATAST